MRFILTQGTREVIFFSDNRFMRFDGADKAADFLLDYLIEPDNLRRLREALGRHQAYSWLAMRDDATVLDYTSRLLSEGMLHMLADPEAQLPWTWQFRSPTFPTEVVKADFESNPLAGLEDAMEEAVAELEDAIPEPVLPPTFIQVAEFEAKGIEFQQKMYELAMDLLRFVGVEFELPSELAPNYTEVAQSNGSAIDGITESFAASLEPLVQGGSDPPGTTQAGEQMLKLAHSQGFGVQQTTETMGDMLEVLTQGKGDPPAPTEVGPALLNEATAQGANLEDVASETADTLLFLAKPDQPELPDTELGPSLSEIAAMQSEAMAQSDAIIQQQLGVMAELGAFDLPPPTVPNEMRDIANSQMVGVIDHTLATFETFQTLLQQVPPGPEAPSQVCAQFQATALAQVESLTTSTDFMKGELQGLTMVAMPEHHDPSPVGDAFLSSADDQTAGMIRAAFSAGESLAGLALPPG